MQDLVREKYPPAMYMVGIWKLNGDLLPKDAAGGLKLIGNASDKDYGPAVYHLAVQRLAAARTPKETEECLKDVQLASTLGSPRAQLDLGNRYEKGEGVPQDFPSACKYFRLCAAQGVAMCQLRLGKLLLNEPGRREGDYLQAVAVLQLAAEQNVAEAKELVARELPNITQAREASVRKLKTQLVRK